MIKVKGICIFIGLIRINVLWMRTPSDNVKDDDVFASIVVEYWVGEQYVEVDALVEHPHEIARLDVLENGDHHWTYEFLCLKQQIAHQINNIYNIDMNSCLLIRVYTIAH